MKERRGPELNKHPVNCNSPSLNYYKLLIAGFLQERKSDCWEVRALDQDDSDLPQPGLSIANLVPCYGRYWLATALWRLSNQAHLWQHYIILWDLHVIMVARHCCREGLRIFTLWYSVKRKPNTSEAGKWWVYETRCTKEEVELAKLLELAVGWPGLPHRLLWNWVTLG